MAETPLGQFRSANGDRMQIVGVTNLAPDGSELAADGSVAPATGTQSNISGSASAVTILAANASRRGASVYNDSAAILYLLLSTATPSATLFTVQLIAGAYYEVPFAYTGILKGLWASATGAARVTEFT